MQGARTRTRRTHRLIFDESSLNSTCPNNVKYILSLDIKRTENEINVLKYTLRCSFIISHQQFAMFRFLKTTKESLKFSTWQNIQSLYFYPYSQRSNTKEITYSRSQTQSEKSPSDVQPHVVRSVQRGATRLTLSLHRCEIQHVSSAQ